ncbi:hypothetical protein [Sphingobacterium arenae]|uniref:Uncharacterized protein n=1 Tax=Sphingobacterium arenae TaxID=1280598 RepID=A0ABR7Y391_9SPHI|nr:hypothetical protein [Sphingobacterium arenae]MBD1425766.1 hypothetical protein [Sphingobacterium arenae]
MKLNDLSYTTPEPERTRHLVEYKLPLSVKWIDVVLYRRDEQHQKQSEMERIKNDPDLQHLIQQYP